MLETNSNTQLTFKTFQNEIENPHILVIGQRGSGKTTLIKDIIKKKGYDMQKDVYVFCSTEKLNPSYSEHVNSSNIYYDYEPSAIAKILKEVEENKMQKIKREIMIVFDDCTLDLKKQQVQEILYNARHNLISYIWAMQYPEIIERDIRDNFDYVFLIGQNESTNLKRIYDYYAGFFSNFYAFKNVYAQLTKDFNCMVINNRGSRETVLDKIFTYKAEHENAKYLENKSDFALNHVSNTSMKTFDIKNLKNSHTLIIGKRGTGKSVLVKDIIENNNYDTQKHVYVFSGTERCNPYYAKFVNNSHIYREYNEDALQQIINAQYYMFREEKINREIMIVFDDCISKKNCFACSVMTDLLLNARHYNISYILTMQYPMGLSPEIRLNMDNVFLLAEDTVSNKKRLYEHYAGCLPDFSSFNEIFIRETKDFGCLVINNRGVNKLCDKIFSYKVNMKTDNCSFNELIEPACFKDSKLDSETELIGLQGDKMHIAGQENKSNITDKTNLESIEQLTQKINTHVNTDSEKHRLLISVIKLLEKIVEKI